MLAKKTSKNQLTLSKNIVKTFFDTTLEGIRDKMKKRAITEEDITRAVKWARKRKSISG